MRNIVPATLLSGALLCAASFAQSAPSAQNPSAPPAQLQAQPASPSPSPTEPQAAIPRIAPGSVIPVQLTKTIDAKKAKPGDEVVAKVTIDLKTASGALVVPKDTKVVGHVTEAQARSKEQKESQIGIAFDHAVLPDGDLSLPMSIQAVIAPPTSANNASFPDQSAPAGGGSGASSPMGAGHSGASGSAGQTQPSSPVPNAVGREGTNNTPQGASAQPQINGNTQGVVGISNLKLEPPQATAQGSVLSSDKNNVKLESGTFMLLKVNQ